MVIFSVLRRVMVYVYVLPHVVCCTTTLLLVLSSLSATVGRDGLRLALHDVSVQVPTIEL
jgi:hypothetical protein